MSILSVVFMLSCAAVIVLAIATTLLSTRPESLWGHLRAIARLCIIAGAIGGLVRVIEGSAPTLDETIFLMGCSLFSASQTHREVQRQRREGVI